MIPLIVGWVSGVVSMAAFVAYIIEEDRRSQARKD